MMKSRLLILLVAACLLAAIPAAAAPGKGDPFKGRLFPPNVILEHQGELRLSKEQFTAIKTAVIEVQANIAEHEWDLREAYRHIMAELDKSPIDEKRVLEYANVALLAENQVKKRQMAMLIRVRNLLTKEQVAYLETVSSE